MYDQIRSGKTKNKRQLTLVQTIEGVDLEARVVDESERDGGLS